MPPPAPPSRTAATVWGADIVTKINAPSDEEIALLRRGTILVSLAQPALNPALVEKLAASGVTAMAMDAVPRISRAQALDVLSSMANIAGYRAVIEAAHEFGSFFTGQVTAAGKVPPAKVFVSGAGVAGLAAIGTANSLGAIVRATDVRPEVGEQVESMGAQFVKPDVAEQEVSTDGYAKEVGADYAAAAAVMYAAQAKDCDIIVTTALIPGTPGAAAHHRGDGRLDEAGSVIVDMAASNGGNVAGSVADQMVVTDNGVKIIGYTDLPGRLPTQASQLYGTNIVNLMKLVTPGKDGVAVLDWDDVIVRGMTVAKEGAVTWPPPPVQVSAAPAAAVGRRRSRPRRPSHRPTPSADSPGCSSGRCCSCCWPTPRRRRSSGTSWCSCCRSSSATTSSATSTTRCIHRSCR
jgi:NAD(P) transhydrogenase subunit alpha